MIIIMLSDIFSSIWPTGASQARESDVKASGQDVEGKS